MAAFIVVAAIAAVAWVAVSSDDAVTAGEPWTAQARGVSEYEPVQPWSPAERGLVGFAQAPWTAADRGVQTVTLFDVPWTGAARGLP